MLHAIVAESSETSRRWIATRAPNGDTVSRPLKELADELSETDQLGKLTKGVDEELYKRAREVVVGLVWQGTVPYWVTAAVGWIVGVLGFIYEAGFDFGSALFAALAAGTIPGILLVRAIQYGSVAINSVGEVALNTLTRAQSLGSSAESIYRQQVVPSVASLYSKLGATAPSMTSIARVRGYAEGVLWAAYAFAATGIIVAVLGVIDGYTAASEASLSIASWVVASVVVSLIALV